MTSAYRITLCVLLALGYMAYRNGYVTIPVKPVVVIPVEPATGLEGYAKRMTPEERAAVRDFYAMLGRSIAIDPEVEPVFPDTAAVRKAHRAGMLMVWRGALGNDPGKYPGLREEIESALATAMGTDDVPMNAQRKADVSKAFTAVSEAFQ